MQRSVPLLIVAQSARYLAEAAARSGYQVWAADCFADSDTIAVCERFIRIESLDNPQRLLEQIKDLSQGQSCLLIAGTGVEQFYPLIEQLPAHIHWRGNPVKTLRLTQQSAPFFALLDTAKIAYPETLWSYPKQPADYVLKRDQTWGGTNIQSATQPLAEQSYYQRRIDGQSVSVLILADGKSCHLLSIHQQYNRPDSFQRDYLQRPVILSESQLQQLKQTAQKLAMICELRGLNSIDFIVDKQRCLVLEINPRPSASVEFLSRDYPLLDWHISACEDYIDPPAIKAPTHSQRLVTLYAEYDCQVPKAMNWPTAAHDIPEAQTIIKQGQPICSLLLQTEAELLPQYQQELSHSICKNLLPVA
jgi:predicted ATP-grasp superfamily ATP-dependent carboligase